MPNFEQNFLTPPNLSYARIRLVVWRKIPSLNELFNMSPWSRRRERVNTQKDLLFALQLADRDSSTQTICARNTLSTAYATLDSYLTTPRTKSSSKFVRKKSPSSRTNAP